jgi:hypothetical protein
VAYILRYTGDMFGKTKQAERTLLLLDVESGSVGVALAHLKEGSGPALFAEQRTHLALPSTLSGALIAKQIERAAHEALAHATLVAARLRGNEKTASMGELAGASVFLGAPWGVPNLAAGKPDFSPHLQKFLTSEIESFADGTPLSFYTNADAVAYHKMLSHAGGTILLAVLRGEIMELILLGRDGVLGYGTLPIGAHSLYRTLHTHAGLSLAEIPAVLALAKQSASPYFEPLEAAERHLVEQFASGVESLASVDAPHEVLIVAVEPLGSWFARALEHDASLGGLFAPEATVRTLGARHAAAHLAVHAPIPDLHLALAALFMQGKTGAASGV